VRRLPSRLGPRRSAIEDPDYTEAEFRAAVLEWCKVPRPICFLYGGGKSNDVICKDCSVGVVSRRWDVINQMLNEGLLFIVSGGVKGASSSTDPRTVVATLRRSNVRRVEDE
jgi:hypothetical protein